MLQGQEEIDNKQNYNEKLIKVVKSYVQDNNLSQLMDLLISIVSEDEILELLSQCDNQYKIM